MQPDTADDTNNGETSELTLVYDKPRYTVSVSTPVPKTSTFTPAPVVRPIMHARPKPPSSTPTPAVASPAPANPFLDKNRLDAILAQAQASQEAAAREAAAAAELRATQSIQASSFKRRTEHGDSNSRRKKPKISSEAKKEKQLMKLVGEFVVKTMSKYQSQMDRETFKKHAKEVSLVERQVKSQFGESKHAHVPFSVYTGASRQREARKDIPGRQT